MRRSVTIALAAVSLFMAAPAGASASNTMTCTFTGVIGNVTPAVQLTGGSGTYEMASDSQTTMCSYNGGQPRNSSIRTTGTFVNTACGTGRWTESSTTIDYGNNGSAEVASADYRFDVTGFHGRWKFSAVNGSAETANEGPADPTDGEEIDGQLTLTPRAGGCTTPSGVTAFDVAGELTITWQEHTMECSFTGLVGNINPGIQLVGGSGTYDMASDPQTTLCSYDGGQRRSSSIRTSGTFTSTLCGSGRWIETTTTVDYGNNGIAEITSSDYQIDLEAWHGRWKFSAVNGSPEDPDDGPPDPTDGREIDGQLTLAPSQGSCTAPAGVTALEAAGSFAVRW